MFSRASPGKANGESGWAALRRKGKSLSGHFQPGTEKRSVIDGPIPVILRRTTGKTAAPIGINRGIPGDRTSRRFSGNPSKSIYITELGSWQLPPPADSPFFEKIFRYAARLLLGLVGGGFQKKDGSLSFFNRLPPESAGGNSAPGFEETAEIGLAGKP